MKVLLVWSNGEKTQYESKGTTIERVLVDIYSKRFIEYDGQYYMTSALLKVEVM